jgi:hypothetical protein
VKAHPTALEIPEGAARVEFKVRFSKKRGKGRRPTRIRVAQAPEDQGPAGSGDSEDKKDSEVDPSQVPRLTRLLVLGHHFERLVRDGVVKDYAEIAWLTRLSRARVTQIANLTLLPPDLQEKTLYLAGAGSQTPPLDEAMTRKLLRSVTWSKQQRHRGL